MSDPSLAGVTNYNTGPQIFVDNVLASRNVFFQNDNTLHLNFSTTFTYTHKAKQTTVTTLQNSV